MLNCKQTIFKCRNKTRKRAQSVQESRVLMAKSVFTQFVMGHGWHNKYAYVFVIITLTGLLNNFFFVFLEIRHQNLELIDWNPKVY